MDIKNTAQQIRRGMAIVRRTGRAPDWCRPWTSEKNTSLSNLRKYVRGLLLSKKAGGRRPWRRMIKDIPHKGWRTRPCPSCPCPVATSRRWSSAGARSPTQKILLMDEATPGGIDIGAKTRPLTSFTSTPTRGLTILVVSSGG